MLLLNSEATNTNGAKKPCQSPSQKPATTLCSLVVPLDWLGPGAHPARMTSNSRTSTSKVKEDFIAIAPLPIVTKHGHEKTQNEGQILPTRLRGSAERVLGPKMSGSKGGIRKVKEYFTLTGTLLLRS